MATTQVKFGIDSHFRPELTIMRFEWPRVWEAVVGGLILAGFLWLIALGFGELHGLGSGTIIEWIGLTLSAPVGIPFWVIVVLGLVLMYFARPLSRWRRTNNPRPKLDGELQAAPPQPRVAQSGATSAPAQLMGADERQEVDRRTFQALRMSLPWATIQFTTTNNFAGFSFPRARIDPLWQYEFSADDPANEFLDAELEGLRATLVSAIRVLSGSLAVNTFSTHVSGMAAVPEEWEYRDPQRFDNAVRSIHLSTKNLGEAYEALIRAGRSRLGVA